MSDANEPTLSITVTGTDRPGVTGALLGAVAEVGAEVLDIQQVVVHDHLTLTLLLAPSVPDAAATGREALEHLRDVAAVAAHRLDLTLSVT
ncbi:MAG TPA: ACT domain-containing protein, partial [Intrasporangium sp.]|nr:ACT domain-containing protein [Intrasporangium sp.]